MNSVADVWDNVLSQLKGELSETTIATWFDELEAVDIQGNTFILHCSNDFKKGYIESLFMKNIKASLHDIFSTDFEVKILDDLDYAELKDNRPHRQSERFTSAEFTFETFVVGPSNKLAYAASVSVAEHPAQNYNPLLIYGDSGLGKTHLIYAIANVIRRNDPRSKIAYVKGDDLTNELVDAIREGKTAEMREKYRQADLLLVDDVQFIAGKKQTQEEFFHTFNSLYDLNKQIVISSDRAPNKLVKLEERLRSRFMWNLIADLQPADYETRVAILMKKAENANIEIDDDLYEVICLIAEKIKDNIRELEGAFNRIVSFSTLMDEKIDKVFAKRILKDIIQNSGTSATPEKIKTIVSRYFNIKVSDMESSKRTNSIAFPRQVAMFLCRDMTDYSLPKIGNLFGGRHYTTVMHACEKIQAEIHNNDSVKEVIENLKKEISE